MTTLPSFVQLMASLGLDNDRKPLEGPGMSPRSSPHPHSRTSSVASGRSSPLSPPSRGINIRRLQSSPSIVITQDGGAKPSRTERHASTERRVSPTPRARYSPYSAPIDVRRGSLPAIYGDDVQRNSGHRRVRSTAADVPPVRAKSDPHRPAALRLAGSHRRRGRLSADNALELATPISALARRRSPQASPTSASFPSAPSDSPPFPLTPVSVPTLPPAVFGQLQSYTFPSPDDDGMYVPTLASKDRAARTGVRLSASHDDDRPRRR